MAARREIVAHAARDARLEPDLGGLAEVPARGVAGGLRVLAVGDQAQDHLHVPLRLHVAPHDAQGGRGLSGACDEARHDGVVGALAARDAVGVARIEREAERAVLQRDARAGDDDARAEAEVVGLNERHHASRGVGGGQVDGAVLAPHAPTGPRRRAAHLSRGRVEVGWLEQRGGVQVHVLGIGDVAAAGGEGQLHGLELKVDRLGAVHGEARDAEAVEDAQRHERGEPLTVGGQLVDHGAAERQRQRLDPGRAVLPQIVLGHEAVLGGGGGGHADGELADVEALAFGDGELFQRRRQVGVAEQRPGRGRVAARQEHARELAQAAVARRLLAPERGRHGRHGEALSRIGDRGRQE